MLSDWLFNQASFAGLYIFGSLLVILGFLVVNLESILSHWLRPLFPQAVNRICLPLTTEEREDVEDVKAGEEHEAEDVEDVDEKREEEEEEVVYKEEITVLDGVQLSSNALSFS
jgi:hypothetical protein